MEEDQYTKHLVKIRSVGYFMCEILGKMFYPNLQSFVWRRRLMGTRVQIWQLMATGNQTTHHHIPYYISGLS